MNRSKAWLVAIPTVAGTMAGGQLVAAQQAHASGGSVTFTDAYVPQARYASGAQVPVTAVLHETTGAKSRALIVRTAPAPACPTRSGPTATGATSASPSRNCGTGT